MQTKKCPIRNPNIRESDLLWDLSDIAECCLEPEGVCYKITVEVFFRISAFSPPQRNRLIEWILKQHGQGQNVPEVTTETLKLLGLG
ncbi:MAG: hypothetical protein OXI80_19475 [Caldilineaceae bacterium]|nr:hypothetical protein [Caldilineaceae bacterium]